MKRIEKICNSVKMHPILFTGSLLLFALLYSIFSGIISLKLFPHFSYRLSIFSILSLIFIAGLSAILVTVEYHNVRISIGNKNVPVTKKSVLGYFGTGFSFFTTACPFCKPLLITLFGIGGAFGLLQAYGTPITLLSIGMLLVSVYLVTSTKKTCSK